MYRICNSLSAAGYQVHLVGRHKPDSKPLSEKNYAQVRLNCLFVRGKLFYLEYNIRLFAYLLFKKFDVICSIDLDTILACYTAAVLKGRKCVYDAHEYFTELPEVVGRPMVRNAWQALEKFVIPRIERGYTVSKSIAEAFAKKYRKPFEVILNVPVLKDLDHADKTNPYILYQGALNEGRGLENLILAMKDLDSELHIAGEGDLSEQLRELSRSTGVDDKVKFLGYVQPDDLREVTLGAYVGINILEDKGMSYRFSLSNKFFDYIEAELPSVCIDFPEYKRINDEHEVAVLVSDVDVLTIRSALERLMDDQDLYNRLKQNCMKAREVFNWQKEEKKLLDLYKSIHG